MFGLGIFCDGRDERGEPSFGRDALKVVVLKGDPTLDWEYFPERFSGSGSNAQTKETNRGGAQICDWAWRARMRKAIGLALVASVVSFALGSAGFSQEKHKRPVPEQLVAQMSAKGMTIDDPILVRVYKMESELEIWKRDRTGRYSLLKRYPICRWSGQLGPKTTQGDRQAPEGFYSVRSQQLNPNSQFYLSYDLGYPNAFDRAYGRTGSALMVHGACTSAGCYAMTNTAIAELYALAREALRGGQDAFQVQALPFRYDSEEHGQAPRESEYRVLEEFERRGRLFRSVSCSAFSLRLRSPICVRLAFTSWAPGAKWRAMLRR